MSNLLVLRENGVSCVVYDRVDKTSCRAEIYDILNYLDLGISIDGVHYDRKELRLEPFIAYKDTELEDLIVTKVLSESNLDYCHVRLEYTDDMVILKLYMTVASSRDPNKCKYVDREYDGERFIVPEYDWDDSGVIEKEYKEDLHKGYNLFPKRVREVLDERNGSMELMNGHLMYVNYLEWRFNKFGKFEKDAWLSVIESRFA